MLRRFFPWLFHDVSFPPTQQPDKPRFANVRGRLIAADIPYLIPKDGEDANRLDFY